MEGNTIKVKAKLSAPSLFDVGDKLEVISLLRDKDTILVHPQKREEKGEDGQVHYKEIKGSEVVAKKGSFMDYKIKLSNGKVYDSNVMFKHFGYKSLSEIFDKV